MAFTIAATSYGLIMIWMGEEIGEYKEKTIGIAKLDWSLIEDREDNSNAINKQHLQYYKDIIQLRKLNLYLNMKMIKLWFGIDGIRQLMIIVNKIIMLLLYVIGHQERMKNMKY